MKPELIYRQLGRDYYYKTWHTLKDNMFLYIHSGDGSIVSRERTYPMEGGLLCFIGADRYHYTFPEHPESYERTKLFVSSEDLEKIMRLFPAGSAMSETFTGQALAFAALGEKDARRSEELLKGLWESENESEFFRGEFYSAVIELMTLTAKNLRATVPKRSGAMQKAIEYINDHISEEISLDSICASGYLSKYHFCRQFKAQTGLTVMEYVLKTRIMIAKEMLKEDLPISRVSNDCGFSSPSYFSRAFKADTGVSPISYKKSIRKH